jgi:hypothetical protein
LQAGWLAGMRLVQAFEQLPGFDFELTDDGEVTFGVPGLAHAAPGGFTIVAAPSARKVIDSALSQSAAGGLVAGATGPVTIVTAAAAAGTSGCGGGSPPRPCSPCWPHAGACSRSTRSSAP